MACWFLHVETPSIEHAIRLGATDESVAVEALNDAKKLIGHAGVVTVQNRLALKGANIVAVWLAYE